MTIVMTYFNINSDNSNRMEIEKIKLNIIVLDKYKII
jgi:hypothetical protein